MALFAGLVAPDVRRHLLTSENEYVIDEIQRHWVTRLPGAGLVLLGIGAFALAPFAGEGWWICLVVGLVAGAMGFGRIHVENMDRFVVTNMRVFRVHGVLNQQMASVPIARILDITVDKPFIGQLFGFGHFVFESAAQDQGLKRIQYVPDIERRDRTIQTVIQRAGLRARVGADRDEMLDLIHAGEDPRGASRAGRLHRLADRISHRYGPDADEIDGV